MSRLCASTITSLGLDRAEVFVETGTQTGLRLRRVCRMFQEVHTIELNPELHAQAKARLGKYPHVHCHLGDSAKLLHAILDPDKVTALYLDAHYVAGGDAAQAGYQCPLLDELKAIVSVPWRVPPRIVIDDAQFFQRWAWRRGLNAGYDQNQFPTLEDIQKLVGQHGYTVRIVGKVLLVEHSQGARDELEGTAG